jgi:hypothetical protein
MRKPKPVQSKRPQQRKPDDLSRCLMPLVADQTLIAVWSSACRVGSLQV